MTVGLPGTGLSCHVSSSSGRRRRGTSARALKEVEYEDYLKHISIRLDAQGNVFLVDDRGYGLPDWVDKRARRDLKTEIQNLHRARHEEKTRETDDLLHIHREAPRLPTEEDIQIALQLRQYSPRPFPSPPPKELECLVAARAELLGRRQNLGRAAWIGGAALGFTGMAMAQGGADILVSALCGGVSLLIVPLGLLTDKQYWSRLEEDAAKHAESLYAQRLLEWEEAKRRHEEQELAAERELATTEGARVAHLQRLLDGDSSAIEQEVEWVMEGTSFPLETNIAFEVSGTEVRLDVDLPEIEHLPTLKSKLLSSGKSKMSEKSQKELREQYARIVHGTAFRLGGVILASVPACRAVVVSGFTQRMNPTTGQIQDDYIYSVRIDREGYGNLDPRHMDIPLPPSRTLSTGAT